MTIQQHASFDAKDARLNDTSKANPALTKLVQMWENQNAKRALKGSGISLMALSLTACGGSDDTAADAATAAAAAAATAAAAVLAASEAETAAALAANAVLETSAAEAAAAQAAAEATAAEAAIAQAAAEAAQAAAEAAQAAAAQATADAAAAAEAALTAINPISLAPSNPTESVVGTLGNDAVTGIAANYEDTDRIIDPSGTDADTLVIDEAASVNPDVTNIEGITLNLNALGSVTTDASKITGADTLTINRGDVEVGGSTLNGNKAVVVTNVDASGVAKIIVGAGTTTVDIDSAAADKAGLVVDADAATTTVTIEGASTVNAAIATGTVSVVASSNTDATEVAKATVVNAAAAATVTTHAGLTGSVEINAIKASTITISDAQGGAVVNGATTSTADSTITIVDVDASGAVVNTGTGSATASAKQITVTLDGTALTTDTATVSGSGVIAIDLDAGGANTVDIVTLSAAEANATYNVGTNAETMSSITKGESGSFTVNVAGNENEFSAVTVTGFDTLDLNAGTAGTVDGSKWTVGKVDLGFNNTGSVITVSEAAIYEVTANQTGLDFDMGTGASSMSIVSGDVNGATDTTVGTLTVGAMDAAASTATTATTVVLTAEESNFTATSVVLGAAQVLEITGDENVTLGNVTAATVNAGSATGNISLTAQTALSGTVTTGSGSDTLVASGADVHTFVAGNGIDTITVTTTNATSSFDGGAGDDAFTLTSVNAYAAVGGDGDDTFTTGADIESSVVGGGGSDTLTLSAAIDFTDNTTFAIASIEKLDLINVNGTTQITAAQLANNPTMVISATGANDALTISNPSTGGVLDASGLTTATGSALSALTLVGTAQADTITGGVLNETYVQTVKDDTITGGEKSGDTDKLSAITTADTGTGVASVINMSNGAITSTEILAKTGLRTALDVESAAGTMQTLFNDSVVTNNAAVTTFSEIEQIVGTSGKDYIKGSSGADTITGGAGDDYIAAGDGDDTVISENTDVKLDGGGGTDTLSLAATTVLSNVDANVVGFENITLGAGSVNLTLTGQSDGFVITGGTGANVIIGSSGADTITPGLAADSVTAGLGLDSIILGAAGQVDTVIMTTGGAIAIDTVSGFIVAGGEDELQVDLSDLNAITGTMQKADNSAVLAAGGTNSLTVTALGSAGGDFGATAGSMVTIAGAAAYTTASLETAIEGSGTAAGMTAGDSILIAYDDTANTYIALLTDNAGTADGSSYTDITITNLLELTGVGAAETLLTTSFAIIT